MGFSLNSTLDPFQTSPALKAQLVSIPMDDIRNCAVAFRKVCPRTWDGLQPTLEANVRFCGVCQHAVFFCATDAEAIHHARQGHCIAKPVPDITGLRSIRLGRPATPEPSLSTEQAARLAEFQREAEKTRALRDTKYATRYCPDCGYPCPSWVAACRVCGCQLDQTASEEGT